MSKQTDLQSALNSAAGKPDAVKTTPQPNEEPPKSNTSLPPSRQGKKAITGYFDPAVSRQLKQIALDQNTTIQDLLAESLNDLFVKYRKSPLA
jgi:hypothetical protein